MARTKQLPEVIAIFFATKEATPSNENIAVDTHVLRFRGSKERKAFILGTLKDYTVSKIKSTAIAAGEEAINS